MSFRRGRPNEGNTFLKNLPFGLAYTDVSGSQNTEFPVIPLPVNNPITKKEQITAITYINQTDAIKDGPFYLGSISDSTDSNDTKTPTTNSDNIERYSDKYLKKRKIGISIDDHPYHLELFPKELYNVMGINKKKLVKIRKMNNNKNNVFTGTLDDETLGLSVLEKLKQLAENVDDEDNNEDENTNRRGDDDISDNDFDEDEDEDDDNDYNGERYFDNGDDDGYGDEDDNGDEPAF
ncbi:similar to Saccharomyces cerevisiae YNL151C RPC31 RNA polymerase III subunit C31 [Maudiozyma barnettii]|uniref:DNA-directed RNA polymerase III subunit n=1 Tax=Maudiozyma barnettii TaxID=61262 RepID=A0A8H2ZFF1_9SACH|nr:DNA-directed RNA polymerase III subunit C31 [Kazachstania barnettii]CAB4252295.1 similar to Saccharomyces cerevisiae YNL151C RPC31 RNA polymerase III subunit C31 [Kazachstania barnettii]CAD1779009.1 similar to Saccharomyces cerevisiae YNL151C RPC31 RNA polymerase III subunit C31 [Kazachstania barnettii]